MAQYVIKFHMGVENIFLVSENYTPNYMVKNYVNFRHIIYIDSTGGLPQM